jgi:LL-diaminopimelate aminotransferase
VDSSVIMGMTGRYEEASKGFGRLQYMVCRPENDFFPDLSQASILLPHSTPAHI